MASRRSYQPFPTTHWSQIGTLRDGDEHARQEALGLLVTGYWPAVYTHLRAQGCDREAAVELTQAFFTEIVIGRGLLERASEQKGRLRTFLLAALRHFRIDEHRRDERRVTTEPFASKDDLDREDERGFDVDAESAFGTRWAAALLERALDRCEQHFRESGRAAHWELFESRVLWPAITGNKPERLCDSSREAGFKSPIRAAAAVQAVKRRAAAILREVVSETLADGVDLDDEMAAIQDLLDLG